jgi:HAD superfamily hydrolase (TIGR01509 family)
MELAGPERAYDAVVFDFDGVILDTETPFFHAWREIYEELGLELTVEEWATCIGTHGAGFDPLTDLAAKVANFEPDPILERARARKNELTDLDTLLPGIADWLEGAATHGIAIAVASSSSHEWVHGHLGRLALADRFGHFSCRTELIPPKPAPDLYLDACAALGVEPGRALAVEDSPNGVSAAKAAGMDCVAVPHALTAGLDLSSADLIVESLADLPLVEALRGLSRLSR